MKIQLIVAVCALAQAEAALKLRQPPAFMERNNENLVAAYTFQQSECDTGAFTSEEEDSELDVVGPLSFNFNGDDRCPQVEKDDTVYPKAMNGVRFSGLRSQNETLKSEPLKTDVKDFASFSAEMWFTPNFSSSSNGLKKYILMELGGADPERTDTEWSCNGGSSDFTLSYNDVGTSAQFEISIDALNGCALNAFKYALEAGQTYHIVVTPTPVAGTSFSQVNVYVNGAAGSAGPVEFTIADHWDSTQILRIGSSPAADSGAVANDDVYAWDGIIHFAAIYKDSFPIVIEDNVPDNGVAAALDNFNQFLPNSAPSLAVDSSITPAKNAFEDEDSEVDFSALPDIAYDFDFSVVFPGNLPESVNAGGLTNWSYVLKEASEDGTLNVDVDGPNFNQARFTGNSNFYGETQIKVALSDGFGVSEGAATVTILVKATDDAAIAVPQETPVAIQQTATGKITFSAIDTDCSLEKDFVVGPEDIVSCTTFGKINLTILEKPQNGALFEAENCDNVSPKPFIETFPHTIQSTEEASEAGGLSTASICFTSCFSNGVAGRYPGCSDPIGGEGVLEDIAYTVDGGEEQIFQVQIDSVLSIEREVVAVNEDSSLNLTLTGTDALCSGGGSSDVCDSREKSFQITSLPDPSVGILTVGTSPVAIDEEYEESTIFTFTPASNYFNRAAYLSGEYCDGPEDMPDRCVNGTAGGYTNLTLTGAPLGNCETDNCAITFNAVLVVGSDTSKEDTAAVIWVNDVNDAATVALDSVGPFVVGQEALMFNSEGVIADVGEEDLRTLQVTVSLSDGFLGVASGQLSNESLTFEGLLDEVNSGLETVLISPILSDESLASVTIIDGDLTTTTNFTFTVSTSSPTVSPTVSPSDDEETDILVIVVPAVVGGMILILALLLFFCKPKPEAVSNKVANSQSSQKSFQV